MNVSVLIIGAIALAIALGYLTRINTGIYAIVFAYLIGAFALNMSPNQITALWPLRIFFIIFAVSLFYNFSMNNGTLEKIAMHILYRCRRHPGSLSYIIYFIATVIAGLGAGYFAVMAFLCPIGLIICKRAGISSLEGVIAVSFGALAGANFMSSMSGLLFRSLIENAGYGAQSMACATSIFIMTFVTPILMLTGIKLFTKGSRSASGSIEVEAPQPLTGKQSLTLALIVILVLVVLLPPFLHTFMPDNAVVTLLNKKVDISYTAVLLSLAALLLKLGDEKTVVAKVPWGLLIMICGIGMLIAVAVKAGTIKMLAGWLGENVSPFFMPVVIAAVAGVMSFFSSTLGVVAPTLFAIVPSLSAASGVSPMVLFTCIIVGSQATGGASPFSSGGSLALSSCETDEERNRLFNQLMFIATPGIFAFQVLTSFLYGLVM